MYDLHLIVSGDQRRGPETAADDLAIKFDGNALFGKGKQADHAREVSAFRHFASFPIQVKFHLVHEMMVAVGVRLRN